MKKFLFILLSALVMTVAFAQPHKESRKLTDDWYVGINVGAVAPVNHSFDWANHNGFDAYHKEIGVEVARWITPVVGLGASYELLGNVNGSKTWSDMGNALIDGHVNLSNLFAGYKPRKWDVELIPSVGFSHFFGNAYPNNHRFYALGRLAVGLNYNASDAWTLYIRPAVQYYDRFHAKNGMFDVRLGANYYFKNSDGKHRMSMCENLYTAADYESLKAKYNNLRDLKPQVIHDTVHDTVYVHFNTNEFVYFSHDSFDLPEGGIIVTGYASEEGTPEHNEILCWNRALAVKKALVQKGFNEKNIEVRIGGVTNKFGPNLEDNRVVTIITK